MIHPNTERLLAYWKSRRTGEDAAPLRSAIDPAGFAPLLSQVFILGRRGPGDWRFRLAGGLVADLHGRSGADDGLGLWAPPARMQLSACLEAARRKAQAFVVTARGRTAGGRGVELEVLYAPLRPSVPDGLDRCLGLYQPLTPVAHLGAQPLERLDLIDIGAAEAGERLPSLQLAALDGRRIA